MSLYTGLESGLEAVSEAFGQIPRVHCRRPKSFDSNRIISKLIFIRLTAQSIATFVAGCRQTLESYNQTLPNDATLIE